MQTAASDLLHDLALRARYSLLTCDEQQRVRLGSEVDLKVLRPWLKGRGSMTSWSQRRFERALSSVWSARERERERTGESRVRALRRDAELLDVLSLDAPADDRYDNSATLSELVPQPGLSEDDHISVIAIHQAMGRMPARDAYILHRSIEQGVSLADIADELGLSRERVRQIQEAALESVRRRIFGVA